MFKYPTLWEPLPYRKGYPPFGFKANEDKTLYLVVPEIALLIEEALSALEEGASLREAADFLNSKLTDRKLSYVSLSTIYKKIRTGPKKKIINQHTALKQKGITPTDRKIRKRRNKISDEKKKINFALKRIQKLGGDIESIQQEEFLKTPLKGVVEVQYEPTEEQKKHVIFEPNKGPQTEFLMASEQEVLYGGAAGGGKSYAMLADPIRYFSNPNFNGLLLRRTTDELRELKWKARDLYDNKILKGKFNQQESLWRFPSGAQLWLTYLERDEDVKRYQGQSFTWIGVDELTQYSTPFAWDYLRSRLRSVDPTIQLSMRATSNPGGPGHGWVKAMFIDPAPPNTTYDATNIDTGEILRHPEKYPMSHPKAGQDNPKAGQPLFQRRFIPASLYDNPYLLLDEKYESSLLSLPEQQRRQLLEGDWTVAEGAAFSEFRTSIHVQPYQTPPDAWRRFRSCDYGYASASAVHWYAIDPDGTLHVYRELYTKNKTGKELAQMVLAAEIGEKIVYGVLDSSVWAMRGQAGPSIAEEMIGAGCRWRPSDRSQGARTAGKNRLHELLKVDPKTGKPGIIFYDNCRRIIADLPVIPVDPDGKDDIDLDYVNDHAYDSIRYGIMTRPRPASPFDTVGASRGRYIPQDTTFGY